MSCSLDFLLLLSDLNELLSLKLFQLLLCCNELMIFHSTCLSRDRVENWSHWFTVDHGLGEIGWGGLELSLEQIFKWAAFVSDPKCILSFLLRNCHSRFFAYLLVKEGLLWVCIENWGNVLSQRSSVDRGQAKYDCENERCHLKQKMFSLNLSKRGIYIYDLLCWCVCLWLWRIPGNYPPFKPRIRQKKTNHPVVTS